jgi:hypothetical protein
MNLAQKSALANTELKAEEFARMHDEAVDKALVRGNEEKADTHRNAANFLRTAVPALVKSVLELNEHTGRLTTEGQQLRNELEGNRKRTDAVRNGLEKLITNTKTNLDYLRRGRRDPASMAAIKILEDLHKQQLLVRNALEVK